nr:uncharacterized protein LOC107279807 [Oryza sativa Japonica Group]XP_015649117.1 uncharacterized protein LOC107281876 [Oryza sativa Japonica Group]
MICSNKAHWSTPMASETAVAGLELRHEPLHLGALQDRLHLHPAAAAAAVSSPSSSSSSSAGSSLSRWTNPSSAVAMANGIGATQSPKAVSNLAPDRSPDLDIELQGYEGNQVPTRSGPREHLQIVHRKIQMWGGGC